MLLLVLATVLAQPAPSAPALVTSRRTGVPAELAQKLAGEMASRLLTLGLSVAEPPADSARKLTAKGISDSSDCAGNRECLSRLGTLLSVPAVIGFEVGQVGDELAVHVELVEVRTSRRLAQASFVLAANPSPAAWDRPLKPFAVEARAALASLPPEPEPKRVQDVPQPGKLLPREPEVIAPPIKSPSRVPSYALGAGAIAATGMAAGFFAIATHQRAALYGPQQADGRYAPAFSRSESQARADIYDRNYMIAAGSAALAVALGVGSYLLLPGGER